MKLNTLERIALLGVLPKENSFLVMRIVQDLQKKVGFSADEHTSLQFMVDAEGRVTWNNDQACDVEVEINTAERELVSMALIEKDSKQTISTDHLTLYEKFVLKRE